MCKYVSLALRKTTREIRVQRQAGAAEVAAEVERT